MGPVEKLLTSGMALIQDEKNWTKEVFARDENGEECDWKNEKACQWCSDGALLRVAKDMGIAGSSYTDAYRLFLNLTELGLVNFNDDHTHAEVMDLWKKAKAVANERGI